MKELKEGFYHLHNENETTPVLVHVTESFTK